MTQNIFNFIYENWYIWLYQLILTYCLIISWSKIQPKILHKRVSGKQDTHITVAPRLGGLILYTTMMLMGITSQNSLVILICLVLLPIFLVGTSEDIFDNVRPKIRIFSMIFSSLLFITIFDFPIPIISIPYVGQILSNTLIGSIFLTFCIIIITNGMNLIDGSNGNASLTGMTILSVLCYLFMINNNVMFFHLTIFFIIILFLFVIFNYPIGKIFLGDTGAYIIGFLIACLCIKVFYNNPSLPSWIAVLILFYPAFEVLFSYTRKIFCKKNPFLPDREHLHILIFDYLLIKGIDVKNANNAVVIILIPLICLGPYLAIINPFASVLSVLTKLVICFWLYIFYYYIFMKLIKMARIESKAKN